MKGKTAPIAAVAITLLISALPCAAANPNSSGAGATRSSRAVWPKWYYYDQLGLREWHKGDKDRALGYFDQSYKMAESACGGAKALDNNTKRMLTDVINHQQFHLTVWRQPSKAVARGATMQELVQAGKRPSKNEREKQLRFLEGLERFAKRALGPKHFEVQAIERNRHYVEPEHEEDAGYNTQGKSNHGVVIRPKWYTNNERDFTPETFTREARKVHQEGTEDQKRMDVTLIPQEKVEKGFAYSGGKKIDLSKVGQVQGKGWGGSSTVSTTEVANPNQRGTGWGADGAANYGDRKTNVETKWGIGDLGQSAGGKQVKKATWGTSPATEEDAIFNKPWGGGGDPKDTKKD